MFPERLAYELYMTEEKIPAMKHHGMFINTYGFAHYWLGNLKSGEMNEVLRLPKFKTSHTKVRILERKQKMSKIDELYEIRLATINDVDAIMDFIRREWNENHILASNRELFLWQYGCTEYGNSRDINVLLMVSRSSGEIMGMQGFVQYSEEKISSQISTAIIKISPQIKIPMAGVELLRNQTSFVGSSGCFASGANPKTILPIYDKLFKHKTGIMQQFYVLNTNITEYKIADIKENWTPVYTNVGYSLHHIETMEELKDRFEIESCYDRLPVKSEQYFKKRYFEHPMYQYIVYGIFNPNKQCVGVVFTREICINGSKILRIVDYRGNLRELGNIGNCLEELMADNGYEYIDLMASDLDETLMKRSGFALLVPEGSNIIPNYFEPFERKNIKIYYHKSVDVVIFKADGDQDRPNVNNT